MYMFCTQNTQVKKEDYFAPFYSGQRLFLFPYKIQVMMVTLVILSKSLFTAFQGHIVVRFFGVEEICCKNAL